jgi:hypothetical protein
MNTFFGTGEKLQIAQENLNKGRKKGEIET